MTELIEKGGKEIGQIFLENHERKLDKFIKLHPSLHILIHQNLAKTIKLPGFVESWGSFEKD